MSDLTPIIPNYDAPITEGPLISRVWYRFLSRLGSTSILPPTTVGNLPTGVNAGTRASVSDAQSTTFYATAVGGGSSNAPVYYTGVKWVIA